MSLLAVKNLKKNYEKGRVRALDNVSLKIDAGEFVSIIGPSGSGKSTLLNMLGALDHPTSGMVYFNDKPLTRTQNLARFRAETIGFVFQLHNLIPSLTALQNVMVAMTTKGRTHRQKKQDALELLANVGLSQRAHNRPPDLSGGERQRIAIARALANDPQIILADEPTGDVDSRTGRQIMDLLQKISHSGKKTLIVITHDPEIAKLARRSITIRDGKIASDIKN